MEHISKNIDDLIKETLSQEEAKFYDDLDEPTLLESFGNIFKGKNKWVTVMVMIVTLVLLAFTIYAIMIFLNADSTKEMITWGVAMFASFISIGFIKVYYWMEMNKNIMLREMKRIELQISLLSNKLEKNNHINK